MNPVSGMVKKKIAYLKSLNNIAVRGQMAVIVQICQIYGIKMPHRKEKVLWLKENILNKDSFCGVDFPKKINKKQKEFRVKVKKKPKGNYVNFYLIPEWERLRVAVLKFYGCKCMKCGIKNCEMHVDHIKPRSLYPDLELVKDNLQVLCKDCNMEKLNLNEIDYRPLVRLA